MADEKASTDKVNESKSDATPETVTAPVVETPTVSDGPDPSVKYVAARAFSAFHLHQLLHFAEEEVLNSRIGHELRLKGSPIKLVKKTAEEIKAGL